jgi:hypothetical protein
LDVSEKITWSLHWSLRCETFVRNTECTAGAGFVSGFAGAGGVAHGNDVVGKSWVVVVRATVVVGNRVVVADAATVVGDAVPPSCFFPPLHAASVSAMQQPTAINRVPRIRASSHHGHRCSCHRYPRLHDSAL